MHKMQSDLPTCLPSIEDGQYPSRPDTISNAPLSLDSMEQDTVLQDAAAAVAKMQIVRRGIHLQQRAQAAPREAV